MRTLLGIIFIGLAIIFGLAFIASIPKIIMATLKALSQGNFVSLAEDLLAATLSAILTYVFFTYGSKWTRRRAPLNDPKTLDEHLANKDSNTQL